MNPSNRGPGQSAKLTRDQLVNDVQSVFFVGSFLAVFLVAGFVLKIILLALLSFWSLKEYITMLSPPLRYHNLVAGTFLVVPLQYYWVGINWYGMFLVFIPLYVFLILPLYLLILPRRENRLSYISQLHWGLMAFVWGLSHLGFLYQLDLGGDGRQTQAIVGLVVVSVCGRLVNSTLQSVPQQFVPESLR